MLCRTPLSNDTCVLVLPVLDVNDETNIHTDIVVMNITEAMATSWIRRFGECFFVDGATITMLLEKMESKWPAVQMMRGHLSGVSVGSVLADLCGLWEVLFRRR
jgi:hypothetical protein